MSLADPGWLITKKTLILDFRREILCVDAEWDLFKLN